MITYRSDDDLMDMALASDRGENGYVMFLTALLLIPLLAIAAIGVDFGVWYLQASENQRAADAAALAGAVWLPDEDKARAVAVESLERNGLDPGSDSTIQIDALTDTSLRVSVSTKSDLSFTGIFISDFAVTRAAVARYVPPVALGSPSNQLGSDGLWLAISGGCSVRENGDLLAARSVAGYPGGAFPPADCSDPLPANPSYTGEYFLAVDVGQTIASDVTIQLFDPTYAPAAGKTTDIELRPPSSFTTRFDIYDADGSAFDPGSGTLLATRFFGTNDASADNVWVDFHTLPGPVSPGRYYIRVQSETGTESYGSNGYAVRATVGGTFTPCAFVASCPQVSAVEHLGLYASLSNGRSDFYLAEVDADHAGKVMEVSLFDIGEGAQRIEILDPAGNPVPFTWQSDCSGPIPPPSAGCTGVSTGWTAPAVGAFPSEYRPYTLDVSGAGTQIHPDTISTSLWNDRTVVINVDIPDDYDVAYSSRWWSVRYYFGADITDRTTWTVRILGDPVRLSG